jgi:O-antigen ligase
VGPRHILDARLMRGLLENGKLLELGLIAAIFIAVGGFGGTPAIPRALFQIPILFLGLLLAASPPKNSPVPMGKLLWFPAVLCAWVAIQWIASRFGRIGLDAHAVESHGLTLVACFAAFFIAWEVARKRAARDRLILSLIGLGLFEAFYGLAEYLAGWQYIWTVPRRYYIGSATGTYINHNHFAGLLEMILPLALCLALYNWQKARSRMRGHSVRAFVRHVGDPEMIKCFLLLLASAVFFLALVFSFSRMGLISMLASLGVIASVVLAGRRRDPLPAALVLLVVAACVAAVAWVGVAPVVSHFEELSRDDPIARGTEGRLALWKDTLEIIRERPWTGAGLGSFEFAFTRVQSHELAYTVEHAHNDYLEFSAELGIPAASLLFLAFFFLAARTLQTSLRARSGRTRALALGILAGTSALLVHSLADFNLHIPANALVFSVLLGMGVAMSAEASASSVGAEHSRRAAGNFPQENRQVHATSAAQPEWEEITSDVKGSRSS